MANNNAETIDSQWHIPASLTSAQLSESLSQIEKYANDPPVFEDGLYARELLRRKLLPPTNRSKRRDALSSDDASSGDDNEMLFEPGGPTEIHGPKEKKKGASPRKKRPKIDAEEGALEKLREEKRLMNEAAEALKKNKIKSAKWIEDSDDDSEADREFFAAEEIIRNNGPRSILGEPILVGMGRMAAMPSEDEDGDEHMVDAQSPAPPTRKRKKQQPKKAEPKKKSLFGASSGSESDSDVPDRSSSVEAPSTSSRRKNVKTVVVSDDDEEDEEEPEGRNKDVEMADDEDEEDLPVSTKKRRVSRRAVVDSDDE